MEIIPGEKISHGHGIEASVTGGAKTGVGAEISAVDVLDHLFRGLEYVLLLHWNNTID